jgi:hypothetical protein
MDPMRVSLPLLMLVCLATASPPGAAAEEQAAPSLPAWHVADPTAPRVTAENLLASERFWPYHVALVAALTGQQPLPAGTRGVLIRVEPGGVARVDFGRDGVRTVPLAATDLVAQAELVRRGELLKTMSNFALAIGPRLLDPGARLRPVDLVQTMRQRGFLAVFGDPQAADFAALARAIAPLRGQDGVETILFPQGEHPDAQVAEQLRAQDFRVPFLPDRMSEAYTLSLLPDGTRPPAVTLQTREGRLLYAGGWSEEALPALRRALAEGLSAPASR